MADSFQKEKPPARVNLFLEVPDGDSDEKVELPFRTLVLGDFTGKPDDTPLEDREVIDVNADNFESVMSSMDLELDMIVPDKIGSGDDDVRVSLKLDSMDSFRPEEVAKQVPEIDRLVAVRNLLQDLRNRVVSMSSFRRQLEAIITDPEQLDRLVAELGAMVDTDDPADASSTDAPA
ncbi:type VI secretion system contractile sheath small subunit [Rubrivirga sp.]|uniref:type VI secretion system contractile sheath small subunit n=1 Tax=Rubrivirga sp. TaxID=1885344 RepID=UPI003B522BD6